MTPATIRLKVKTGRRTGLATVEEGGTEVRLCRRSRGLEQGLQEEVEQAGAAVAVVAAAMVAEGAMI